MNVRHLESMHALNLPLAIICVYLIFSPVWAPGFAPRQYDDARYFELAALALLLITFSLSAVRNAVTLSLLALDPGARILLLILLGGGAISATFSPAPHLGALEVALVTQLTLLMLVVAAANRENRTQADSVLLTAIVAGAVLTVLKFWVIYVMYAVEGKIFPWDSPFIDFANVRFFSQYQSYTLLLVSLPVFVTGVGRYARALLFFAAANFWALHWMVGTRAAWLGLAVGCGVVLVFVRNGKWVWLRNQMLVALAGAVIFLVHSHFVGEHPEMEPVPGIKSIVERGQGSINERLDLAKSAFSFIREHPFVGVGPGQFGLQPYATFAAHPHDFPLQLLSEYGVPAGLAGVVLIGMLAVFATRSLSRTTVSADLLQISLVAALAMGLTDALFSGNLIMPHSQVLFVVLAGWIIGRSLEAPSGIYEKGRSYMQLRFAIVSIGVVAMGITVTLSLEYLPLAREIPVWLPTWNPHFWQYGRFSLW